MEDFMSRPLLLTICFAISACGAAQESEPGQSKVPAGKIDQELTPDEVDPDTKPGAAFEIGSCGSIKVTNTKGSYSVEEPSRLKVGQLVSGRVDRGSASAEAHYWSISLTKGDHYFVIDSKLANGENSNLGMRLELLSSAGAKLEKIGTSNEVELRTRGAFKYTVAESNDYILKVSSYSDIQDYELAVFSGGRIPSPYFSDCPEVKELEFGATYEFKVGGENMQARDTWFIVPFAAGDYQITLDLEIEESERQNIWGSVDFSESFGEISNNLVKIIETGFSAREVGEKPFAAPSKALVRIIGEHKTAIYKAKFKIDTK
jgi:hypothetical protein